MSSTATLKATRKPSTTPAGLAIPAPVAPLDGAPADGSAAFFQWEGVPGATTYAVQVADDTRFQNLRFDASVGDTTSLTLYSALPENGATFYWRLRAGDRAGWSPWSVPCAFTAATTDAVARYEAVRDAEARTEAEPAPPDEAAGGIAPYLTGTTSKAEVLFVITMFLLIIAFLIFMLVYFGFDSSTAAARPAALLPLLAWPRPGKR